MTNVIIEEIVRQYCKDFGIDCPLDDTDTDTEADPPVYPSAPIEEIKARDTESYYNLLKLDALAWTYAKTILALPSLDVSGLCSELDDTDWALLETS